MCPSCVPVYSLAPEYVRHRGASCTAPQAPDTCPPQQSPPCILVLHVRSQIDIVVLDARHLVEVQTGTGRLPITGVPDTEPSPLLRQRSRRASAGLTICEPCSSSPLLSPVLGASVGPLSCSTQPSAVSPQPPAVAMAIGRGRGGTEGRGVCTGLPMRRREADHVVIPMASPLVRGRAVARACTIRRQQQTYAARRQSAGIFRPSTCRLPAEALQPGPRRSVPVCLGTLGPLSCLSRCPSRPSCPGGPL